MNTPSRGLIIRQPWIGLILAGKKNWEMRATKTKVKGRIALIEAGAGLIVGETDLIGCGEPIAGIEEAKHYLDMHCVEDFKLLEKWKYPWILLGTKKYKKPIPYQHPKGAVIWVDLSKAEQSP